MAINLSYLYCLCSKLNIKMSKRPNTAPRELSTLSPSPNDRPQVILSLKRNLGPLAYRRTLIDDETTILWKLEMSMYLFVKH